MKTTCLPFVVAALMLSGCFNAATDVDDGTLGGDSSGGTDVGSDGADSGADGVIDGESSGGGADSGSSGGSEVDFEDEFDADRGDWRYLDDPGAEQEGPGQWGVADGALVQRSDISGPDGQVPSRGTFALGGDPSWSTYTVEVELIADDDGVAGVLCHADEDDDHVRFTLDHETGIVRLVERDGEVFTVLAEAEAFVPPVELGVTRVLELSCGATYRAFVDGALVLEAAGDGQARGGVGVYASSIGDGPDGLRFLSIEVE